MSIIKREGFEFSFNPQECLSCNGACCRGESGKVWVSKEEVEKIATFLKVAPQEFIKREGRRVSLKEIKVGGEYLCIFFDKESCKCEIYPLRPQQCREFPFWESLKDRKNLDEVCKECKGILLS